MSRRTLAALVCYGALAIALGTIVVLASLRSWSLERELFFLRASGWSALTALLLALCATAFGKLLARTTRRPLDVGPFRRALGISAAVLASVHACTALATYLARSLSHVLELVWVRAGLSAWAILLVLWLTSFPPLVRILRVKLWKPLHRLAYVAAIFAFQHAMLAPLAPRGWVLAAFGTAFAIAFLRLIPSARPTDVPNRE